MSDPRDNPGPREGQFSGHDPGPLIDNPAYDANQPAATVQQSATAARYEARKARQLVELETARRRQSALVQEQLGHQQAIIHSTEKSARTTRMLEESGAHIRNLEASLGTYHERSSDRGLEYIADDRNKDVLALEEQVAALKDALEASRIETRVLHEQFLGSLAAAKNEFKGAMSALLANSNSPSPPVNSPTHHQSVAVQSLAQQANGVPPYGAEQPPPPPRTMTQSFHSAQDSPASPFKPFDPRSQEAQPPQARVPSQVTILQRPRDGQDFRGDLVFNPQGTPKPDPMPILSPIGPFNNVGSRDSDWHPSVQAMQQQSFHQGASQPVDADPGKEFDAGLDMMRSSLSTYDVNSLKVRVDPITTKDRLNTNPSVLLYHAFAKQADIWLLKNAQALLHYPIKELIALWEFVQDCPEVLGQCIHPLLSILTSTITRKALQNCCRDGSFDLGYFKAALRNPKLFESAPQPKPAKERPSILEISDQTEVRTNQKLMGISHWASVLPTDREKIEKLIPGWLPQEEECHGIGGSLVSVFVRAAARVKGTPSAQELECLSSRTNPMILIHRNDPIHDTVPANESVLGLFKRVVYIWYAFTGHSNGYVQEQLVYKQCSLISLMSLALRSEPYLLEQLHRLMAQGPSAQEQTELMRLASVIPDLASCQQNHATSGMQLIRSVMVTAGKGGFGGMSITAPSNLMTPAAQQLAITAPPERLAIQSTGPHSSPIQRDYSRGYRRRYLLDGGQSPVAAYSDLAQEPQAQLSEEELLQQIAEYDAHVAASTTTTPQPAYPAGMNAGRKPFLPPAVPNQSQGVPSSFQPRISRDDRSPPATRSNSPNREQRLAMACYLCDMDHPVSKCPLLAMARSGVKSQADELRQKAQGTSRQTNLQAAYTSAANDEGFGYDDYGYMPQDEEDIDPADQPYGHVAAMALLVTPGYGQHNPLGVEYADDIAPALIPLGHQGVVAARHPGQEQHVRQLERANDHFVYLGLIIPVRAQPAVGVEERVDQMLQRMLRHLVAIADAGPVLPHQGEAEDSDGEDSMPHLVQMSDGEGPPPGLYAVSSESSLASMSTEGIPAGVPLLSINVVEEELLEAPPVDPGLFAPREESRVVQPADSEILGQREFRRQAALEGDHRVLQIRRGSPLRRANGRPVGGGGPDDDDSDDDDEDDEGLPPMSAPPSGGDRRRVALLQKVKMLAADRYHAGLSLRKLISQHTVFIDSVDEDWEWAVNYEHPDYPHNRSYDAANFYQAPWALRIHIRQLALTLQPFNITNPFAVVALVRDPLVRKVLQGIENSINLRFTHSGDPDDMRPDYQLWRGPLLELCQSDAEISRCLQPKHTHIMAGDLLRDIIVAHEMYVHPIDPVALGQGLNLLYEAATDAVYLGHHLSLLLSRMLGEDVGIPFEIYQDPLDADVLRQEYRVKTWSWASWTRFPEELTAPGGQAFLTRGQEQSLRPDQLRRYHDQIDERRRNRSDAVTLPNFIPFLPRPWPSPGPSAASLNDSAASLHQDDEDMEPTSQHLAATHIIASVGGDTASGVLALSTAVEASPSRTGMVSSPLILGTGSARSRRPHPHTFMHGSRSRASPVLTNRGASSSSALPLPSSPQARGLQAFSGSAGPQTFVREAIDYSHGASWFPSEMQLGLVSATTSIPQGPSRPTIRRASSELQAQINSHIANSTRHARLDFLDQTGSFESHSLGILINGTRHRPTKVFLDLGATICLIGYSAAVAMNMDIWETSVLLATSTISAQRVLGVTSPVTLQFGLPPNHINFETVLLVTQGMDRLYDLLLSNQVSHAFKGVVNHDIPSTFTLTRPADGAQIVLPLRPSF